MTVSTGLILLGAVACGRAAQSELPLDNFFNLSFAELASVSISTHTERSLGLIPSTVYVYTDEDIRIRGWTSLSDLIQDVPGVDIVNTHLGLTQSVRGVGNLGLHGRKTVVMIDGHNMAFSALGSPGFGGFLNQYDILNAKRVEILIGPGGTLHGANAFGIVIDIQTKTPDEVDGIQADLLYGSNDEYVPSVRFGKQFGDWGLFQSFTAWRQTDSDLSEVPVSKNPDGSLVVYDNDTFESPSSNNYDIHGYAEFEKRIRLGYRFSRVDSTWGTSLTSTDPGALKVDQGTIYFDVDQPLTQKLRYNFKSHYKKTEVDEDESYSVDTTQNMVRSLDLGSESFIVDNQLTFAHSDAFTWVGGAFYEHTHQRPPAIRLVAGTVDPGKRIAPQKNNEQNRDNYAIYLQTEWTPRDNFYAVSGLRYIDSTESRYPSELLPRLGATYYFSEDWALKLNYQRGYRPPSVDEGAQRGIIAPNPNLKSETIDSYEVTLETVLRSQCRIRGTIFYSEIDDLIGTTSFSGTGSTLIEENIASSTIQGAEVGINYRYSQKIELDATASYTDSLNDSTNEDTRTIIPYKLNLSMIIRPHPDWTIVWDNYVRRSPTTDSGSALFGGDDANNWVLSNLTATCDNAFTIRDLGLIFSVRNLFDEEYGHVDSRVTTNPGTTFVTSYHPQESRNFFVGLRYWLDGR